MASKFEYKFKVNTITLVEQAATITLGESGTTVTLACMVLHKLDLVEQEQLTGVLHLKTSPFTAVSGK